MTQEKLAEEAKNDNTLLRDKVTEEEKAPINAAKESLNENTARAAAFRTQAEELSGGAEVSVISTLDPVYDLVITLE